MSVRQQIARDLLQAADRKRIKLDKPQTAAEKSRARRHERKMALLAMAATYRLGLLVRDSVEPLCITYDLAGPLAAELAFEGLVEKEVSGKPGGGRSLTITITDSGRELLESLAP
jgi:DNA-binding MarR family transcriptional regulator